MIDVLEQIHVSEVFDATRSLDLVPEDTPLPEILSIASRSRNAIFPVVDANQQLRGIFSLRDLRSILTGNGAGSLIRAADLAVLPVLTVTPNDDLHTALRVFTQKNIDDVPVVDAENDNRILGMLNRRDVISAYHERVMQLRAPADDDQPRSDERI